MRQVRIQSDGRGNTTRITLEDGTQLAPTEAVVYLEAMEVNRTELTFLGPNLDVHAELSETTMTCPICRHKQTHYCAEGKSL